MYSAWLESYRLNLYAIGMKVFRRSVHQDRVRIVRELLRRLRSTSQLPTLGPRLFQFVAPDRDLGFDLAHKYEAALALPQR
jgi:hypothetical protein